MRIGLLCVLFPIVSLAQETQPSTQPTSTPTSAPASTLSAVTSEPKELASTPQEQKRRRFGMQFDVGVSTFIGDLTDESSAPTYNFQLKFMYVKSKRRPLYGYLSVNTLWTDVTHTGDQFIHDTGAKIDILSFLFVSTLCWNPGYQRLHGCLGLGEGTVNTNSEGNRQDLGTWNYHAHLQYDVVGPLSVLLSAKFIGRLEQQVDFVNAQFSFASFLFGPQYVF